MYNPVPEYSKGATGGKRFSKIVDTKGLFIHLQVQPSTAEWDLTGF